MLGTLILGIIAGWAAPKAEPKVRDLLDGALPGDEPTGAHEITLLSFALCVLLAAMLGAILFHAHALPLAFGATLGVLAPRVYAKWQAAKEPDYDS